MSAARIINPILSEFCQLKSTAPVLHDNVACSQQLRRIKRDLFGAANPSDIDIIFNDEMDKHFEQTSKKWGFDFRHGVPLNTNNNQYDWELVSNQENYHAPQMYTLTRAAHIPLQEWACLRNDLLMDERAERENIIQVTSSSDLSDDTHEDDDDVTVLLKLPAITKLHQQDKQQQSQQQQQTKQLLQQQQQQQKHTHRQQKQQQQKIHQQHNPIAIISSSSICKMQLRKRQPKITEYMKERKRLAQVPKKLIPSKRMRLTMSSGSNAITAAETSAATAAAKAAAVTSTSSSGSSSHNIQTMNNHSISFHFSLRSSERHN